MYGLLEEDEKSWFLRDLILKYARVPDGPMYKVGFDKTRNAEGNATALDRGPLRSAWLMSIPAGKIDLMSQGGGTSVATPLPAPVAGTSTSMGAQHAPDAVDGAQLAVLELRRLPKYQKYQEWPDTALLIAKLFASLTDAKKT